MACPKHDPTNGHACWKAKQETIKVNAKVKVFKLDPSSLTYVITLSSKRKESNKDFTWFAIVTPIVLCTLKNPNCHMTRLPWNVDEAHK